MKETIFRKPGGPDVLRYEEVPLPSVPKDHVLIKVQACALNRLDLWLRSEKLNIELPHITGSDVSGIIEKIKKKLQSISSEP